MGSVKKHATWVSTFAANSIFFFVLAGYGRYSFGWTVFLFSAGAFFAIWLALYIGLPFFYASGVYFSYKENEAKLEALYDLLGGMADDDDDFDVGASAAELKPASKPVAQPKNEPRRNEMAVQVNGRVTVGNRLLDGSNPIMVYRKAIAAARKDGNLPDVTLGRLHKHVGANRTNGGKNSEANQLKFALIDAGFIDSRGGWTETGEAAFPCPTVDNDQYNGYTGDIQGGIPVYTGIQGQNMAVSGGVQS